MSYFKITGGIPLCGNIQPGGSKNSALPIMAASLLASEPVHLQNVPEVLDVHTQCQILRRLGLHVSQENSKLYLETIDTRPVKASEHFVRRMRAGFCVLGPLLARRGRAIVPLPGGCNIGSRPVDLHLKGLAALGADIRFENGYVIATAKRLIGTEIKSLAGPYGSTVTGTANVLCAAVLARGITIIHDAATEPEIVDLGIFLQSLGAKIEGLGTSTIRIEGVDQLGGGQHCLIPDRIETATLLLAIAITHGRATLNNIVPGHLSAVLERLETAGASLEIAQNSIHIDAGRRFRGVDIVATPFPGFPTDVQAQWTALASVSLGESRIEDRVFPSRFMHVDELTRLGAQISHRNNMVTVTGVSALHGATVTACDIRAGAALVLAGLAAKGQTIVHHAEHIDRGYFRLDTKLQALGAQIERARHSQYKLVSP